MIFRSIFIPVILLVTLLITVSCGGKSSGSMDTAVDTNVRTGSPASAEPPVISKPLTDAPVDFNFSGEYEGTCEVKALGMTSRSCEAAINIYHEKELQTLAYMGILMVDMGVATTDSPVMSEPLEIKGSDLISAGDGKDVGDFGANGFLVYQGESDYVSLVKDGEGKFRFQGEYQDPTYGKVVVEGTLQKLAEKK